MAGAVGKERLPENQGLSPWTPYRAFYARGGYGEFIAASKTAGANTVAPARLYMLASKRLVLR